MKQYFFYRSFVEICTTFRDSTKWTFFCLTNYSLHATHLSRLPMGSSDSARFPVFINLAQSVWTLEMNVPTERNYDGNLCVSSNCSRPVGKSQRFVGKNDRFAQLMHASLAKEWNYLTYQTLKSFAPAQFESYRQS